MIEKQLPANYLTAIRAAINASAAISEIYQEQVKAIIKDDGSPVTEADFTSSKIIFDLLSETGIPILGEELEEDSYEIRSQWKENWCVDPLDGTRMFLLRNDEFAVNIGHVVGGEPVFGILASPIERKILMGGPEYGVFIFDFDDFDQPEKWQHLSAHTKLNEPMIIICSHSYQAKPGGSEFGALTDNREYQYLRKGSALKFFNLALGSADIYPRFAPTMEWDIAAGQAILETLGGAVVEAYSGERLRYNKESLFNPHFIAKTKAVL